jgi:hypothetical protein
MGALAKALASPSAYAVKKTSLFSDVKDRIDGAMFQTDLDEVERWLDANDHAYPATWREHFDEMIEKQREEIQSEDIGQIMRDRFDF